MEKEIYDGRLIHPATHLMVGPPSSGKTFRTARILEAKNTLIQDGEKIKNIVFCYSVWQPTYAELDKKKVVTRWVNKLPTLEEYRNLVNQYKDQGGSIVVIDDFMGGLTKDLVEIVTVESRHNNTSTFILYQSLFPSNPLGRQISLNVKYIHAHKNPRENAQFAFMARQINPGDYKWIVEAYHEATRMPYSSFVIDLMQETPEVLRFRSHILPQEAPMCVWVKQGTQMMRV